jgi:hypothetical protein
VPDRRTGTLSVTLPKPQADRIEARFAGEPIVWADRVRVQRDRDDPAWRRTELDPLLDARGYILPELLQARRGASRQPATAPRPDAHEGSELQYLAPYQPFEQGISTLALAYNYHKRTQQLLRHQNQHHAQLSDLVVDSRPALALRDWSEEEWERGRLAELHALGLDIPSEKDDLDWRINLELVAAKVPLDTTVVDRSSAQEALFDYRTCARLVVDALAEYAGHLER